MWDTTKDYRILVASKAKENYLNLIPTASFRGNWNKKQAIDVAKTMNSDFQSLIYSYLEGDELVNSPNVATLIEKTKKIIECLGGDDWNKKFLNNAPKEDKQKTMENIAKVKFFLDTILGLKNRLALGPINDPIIGIDIKIGEVMSVTKHPNADSLMICNVNLRKKAITVVTNDLTIKEGINVGVSLLPPQTFMETVSEGMFLGMNGSILKDVDGELGEIPKGIPMESLNETRNLIESYLK
ncbi:phenylalanine--tRNA ligase beta subunit [Methanobrevibacter oralis]|uniref:Phenylalanine--tRNA ligase beta subunit n=1 Tax=Methanobrevibacter oralis TaxID=66851 RepID=A0A166ASD5_METOA|nr:tRNA-binding protein [Methanobrevibacter oralis]KZX12414.1 phenylalanine--tRNA ligase beta subunit [Methanobrevibacter oralis]